MDKVLKFLDEANSAAQIYKDKIDEKFNVCIGNVSCDMDSAIGAIFLAYYLTYRDDYYNDYGNYEKFWVPIINCPRAEICARIDISSHLKYFGVDAEKLIYIDDMDLDYYSSEKLLKLALIDHNKLDITQQQWENSVVLIVDHHVDLNQHPDAEKIVKFCGSACSLVMNFIFDNNFELELLTKEICLFFSAAILIDTENFKPSLKNTKWGEVDELALARIGRMTMQSMFEELFSKKFDRKLNIDLGLELMMKKDYKNYEWKSCITGISVIFNTLHEIMSTFGVDELKKKLKDRMEKNGLNMYCIITQVYNKEEQAFRELMVYDDDVERLEKVTAIFEKMSVFPMQKKKFTGMTKNFRFYLFKDESVSRKKLEPIFKQIFDTI